MQRKRIESAKLTKLEARTRMIQGAGRLVFVFFGIALGFVVIATAVPQKHELRKLEERLAQAQEREKIVLAERDQRRIELRALREDPRYLEVHARDRLNYSQDGERVLRFRRD